MPGRHSGRSPSPLVPGGRRRADSRGVLIVRTAFVSTYPPRRCGIATFTHDLAAATGGREIAVLHPPGPGAALPARGPPPDPAGRAGRLPAHRPMTSNRCVDVVSIQHEYGIWGGEDGEYVLDFVRALRVPAVATLHTVLRDPTDRQRPILSELVDRVEATVVMSRSAADLLADAYGVDPRRVEVIPHGVPDLPLVDPRRSRPALGLDGRDVILSFGLLGPGKGYELAIDALPAVVAATTRTALLRHRRGDPPGPRPPRGRGVPRVARRPGSRRLGMERPRPVRRSVRRPGRADPLAPGRRRLRDALSEPRPDRVRDAVLRDGRRPGRSSRRRTPTPTELLADGRGVLVAPGSADGARRRRSSRSSATTSCAPRSAARLRLQPRDGLVRRSARSTGGCSSELAAERARAGGPCRSLASRCAARSMPERTGAAPSRSAAPPRRPDRRARDHAARDRVDAGSRPRLLRRRRRARPRGGPAPRARARLAGGRRQRLAQPALPRGRLRRHDRALPELPPSRRDVDRRPGLGGQPGPGDARARRDPSAAPGRADGRAGVVLFVAPSPRPRASPRSGRDACVLLGCQAALEARPDADGRGGAIDRSGAKLRSAFRSTRCPAWPWPEARLTYENALPGAGADRRRPASARRPMVEPGWTSSTG